MDLRDKKIVDIINNFAQHCVEQLKISRPAKISVSTKGFQQMPTAGYYDISNNTIFVCAKNRAIADVLRTIAHELTHCKQMEDGAVFPDDDEGLQEFEDMANLMAGRLVRFHGRKHREIYGDLA